MKTIRNVMLIGLLLILALPVAAQRKVKFGIFDKATEQPIIGAVITYADNEKLKSPQRVVTNMDGEATVEVPQSGKCYYQVVSVGYNPLKGTIGSDSSLKLFMTEDVMKVNEVVVTGSRTARPIKLSPVSTQVLGGKELVDAGYADLTKALQQETPGMNIQKVGFGNEISMQGLDARHVLFLQDGERLTGDMAGNLDYERFNLHAIDRIEIVKGASSTLYGSRASGAVINLITKKTTKPIDIQAGVRWGQMNETNYKNPSKKDFLYMFEKNADRPNLQSWVSAGFNAGKVTSQTDVWYSSSDAFYMYQAENDKKVYTQEANPWLDHDVTITSVASRPPMGIEGTEHISVSQKVFYDPFKNLEILAYGSAFYMNTYDLIQDMTFSQARDWTAGTKIKYSFKDWFKITASLHGDFYDRFKRHERIDERTKVYKSRIFQPRLSITSQKFEGHDLILGIEHLSDDLTSGIGKGGAADLGYGEYDKWTSKAQVDAYLAEHNMTFAVDDSASVYVTMSQTDWNKYCIANKLNMNENPWFDPNNGPAKQLVSGNPVLEKAMSFSGPPPVYTPSFHTYVIRSWDGERYYKLQIISWYDANVQIGDEGGRISYYLDELK